MKPLGRLFWKLLLFIWLGQMSAVLATSALFWLERHEHWQIAHPGGPPPDSKHSVGEPGGPPAAMPPHGPPPGGRGGPPHRGPNIPLFPVLSGVFASLLCAAALAWYFAKPIRHLRDGLRAAEDGDLSRRLAQEMGGRRDELADLGRDFDRMSERLQAAMEGQRRLLHDVSHEMRSPLARLQAAIGLARQQPGRLEDSLQRIEREGERMNRLVGELLTLSRLEAGVAGKNEPVDLHELLTGIVEDAGFEGSTRGVRIDYEGEDGFDVLANPELLRRAVENVVRNAIRHSPEGGKIHLQTHRLAGDLCEIVVEDQGPGVAAEMLPKLFTPFFRGVGHGDGYGLGLAIARRVALSLGGEISAANLPTGGLRVCLRLPLMPAD